MKNFGINSFEDAVPNPEFLIKSIAEQGYSMKTSIADLIDNSISASADKIEILVNISEEPFTLFLSDNGEGMDEDTLKKNMKFPSQSPDNPRKSNDLGRFGLGMKTASFSQTRRFTVLSRRRGESEFFGRTWDVDSLKNNGWKILINTCEEIDALLNQYNKLSFQYLNSFNNFNHNTIIVWQGLYKFDQYLDREKRSSAIRTELTGPISDHLSMVFHRFLEKKQNPIQIRVNNTILEGFNPFPEDVKDFRSLKYKQRSIKKDHLKIEGFILPSRSLKESLQGVNCWTQRNKNLSDMEGMYVYRADRLIVYGGWNDLINKSQRMQLARLRVEVGNSIDHLLQLDVSKSKIVIPFNLRNAFNNYILELKDQATAEFRNRLVSKFPRSGHKKSFSLFEKRPSNKGMLVEINPEFSILKELMESISENHRKDLRILIRMINTTVNSIKKVQDDKVYTGDAQEDGISIEEFEELAQRLKVAGMTEEDFIKEIIPALGYNPETIPERIIKIVKTN